MRATGSDERSRARAAHLRRSAEDAASDPRPLVAPDPASPQVRVVERAALLALQRSAGNAKVAALVSRRPARVQRQKGGGKGFRPVDDAAAEEEFKKKVAKHEKAGKSQKDASFLAMEEMFSERVGEAGGKTVPKSATQGGKGTTTYVMVSKPFTYEGQLVKPDFYNATIDESVYNCHSFTLDEGKKSKLKVLTGLAKKIPKEGGDLAGKDFFEAQDLIDKGIHFAPNLTLDIYPSWVLDNEMRTRLNDYKVLGATDKVAVGDIVVYLIGQTLPHSGRVIAVDKKGQPTMIKSKWGHHSLFEHPPTAVPAHYGSPSYYRKK